MMRKIKTLAKAVGPCWGSPFMTNSFPQWKQESGKRRNGEGRVPCSPIPRFPDSPVPAPPFARFVRAEAGRALYEELGPISFVGAGVAGAGEAGLAVAAGGGSSSP